MKAMILCGGQGTRMREETEYRPKPLVDIGGRPILWHIMKIYAHYGIRDFILCLGYRGSMIKEYFLQYEAINNDFTIPLGATGEIEFHGTHSEQGIRVTLADTGLHSMTGGRVQKAARYIDDDTFLLTYGDGVADIDISALIEFHHSHGKLATMTAMQPVSRFGLLDVAESGSVRSFVEKPQTEDWASAGFFVLNRKVVEYLDGPECVFEQAPLQRLAADGQLMAYRHRGYFFAMDTYREYQYLNKVWDQGEAPWKVWDE
ncbi:MAG: glucose-1-phosphate cytidylyltransferase [Planctomycetaceae bacterium]